MATACTCSSSRWIFSFSFLISWANFADGVSSFSPQVHPRMEAGDVDTMRNRCGFQFVLMGSSVAWLSPAPDRSPSPLPALLASDLAPDGEATAVHEQFTRLLCSYNCVRSTPYHTSPFSTTPGGSVSSKNPSGCPDSSCVTGDCRTGNVGVCDET